jgi:uncharacterized protein YjbJ (UPF0337 family)
MAGRQSPGPKESELNWDRIEKNWRRFKVNAKQRWEKLSEQQLDAIAGRRGVLAGRIQETYGMTREDTERQLADWQARQQDHE